MGTVQKETEKKKRIKNFTQAEVEVLVTSIQEKRNVLFGPLRGPSLTQFHRDRAWEAVVDGVNAVSAAARTVVEVKKKFKDLKCRTKAKANAQHRESLKTGGGQVQVTLSTVDELLLGFIGVESVAGISGGVDSLNLPPLGDITRPTAASTPTADDYLAPLGDITRPTAASTPTADDYLAPLGDITRPTAASTPTADDYLEVPVDADPPRSPSVFQVEENSQDHVNKGRKKKFVPRSKQRQEALDLEREKISTMKMMVNRLDVQNNFLAGIQAHLGTLAKLKAEELSLMKNNEPS